MGQQSRTTGAKNGSAKNGSAKNSGKGGESGGETRRARKNERMAATRERVAAAREAERKAAARRKIIIGVCSAVALVAVGGGLAAVVATSGGGSSSSTETVTAPLDTSKTSKIQGVKVYDPKSRNHIPSDTKLVYTNVPPVGGDHDQVWLNCGAYPSAVPERNAVHAMEHGAVWITYQPTLPADQVAKLQALVRGRTYLVLSPFPGLPTAVTASAWGLQLPLDSEDDPRLTQFIDAYRQGPQTPEPGAPCTGGVGTPS